MTELNVTVYGTPVPQGSTKAFIPKGWNRAIITSDNKKTKPWRQEIAGAVTVAMRSAGVASFNRDVPIMVRAEFYFSKPKSTKKTVLAKVTKPDLDKLLRSVLDALTGIAFEDDSQVVECAAVKRFGTPERLELNVIEAEVPMPLFGLEPAMETAEPF